MSPSDRAIDRAAISLQGKLLSGFPLKGSNDCVRTDLWIGRHLWGTKVIQFSFSEPSPSRTEHIHRN